MRKKAQPTKVKAFEGADPLRTLNLLGPGAKVDEMIACAFIEIPCKQKSSHENKDSVDASTSKMESGSKGRITTTNRFNDQDRKANKNTKKMNSTSVPHQKNLVKNFQSLLKNMNMKKQSFEEKSQTKSKKMNNEENNVHLKEKAKKAINTSNLKRNNSRKNIQSPSNNRGKQNFNKMSPSKRKKINNEENEMYLRGKVEENNNALTPRQSNSKKKSKSLKGPSSEREHPCKKRKFSNEKDEIINEEYESSYILKSQNDVNGSISISRSTRKRLSGRILRRKRTFKSRNNKGQFIAVHKYEKISSPPLNSCLIFEKKLSPKKNFSVSFNLTENYE